MAKEYIELTAAIKATCENCTEQNICGGSCDDTDRLRAIPAADVVTRDCYDRLLSENDELRKERPVVRCGECEYKKKALVNKKGFLICHASGMEITDNDYCSYGAKIDGDGE